MGNVPTSVGNQLQKYARNGDEEAFHQCLQANSSLNLNNKTFKNGNTVLHTAAKNGNVAIAAELITNQSMDVNIINSNGYTPLHLACMEGQVGTVEELLLLKADKDIAGGVWRSTPLHWACIKGEEKVIRLLLEKGANPDVKDDTGKLPFQFIKDDELRAQLMSGSSNIHVESAAELEEESNKEKARLAKHFAEQAAIDAAKKAAAEKAEASAPPVTVEVAEEETGTPKEMAPQPAEEEEEYVGQEDVPQLPKTSTSATKSPKKTTQTFKEGDRIEGKHQGGMRWYPGIIAEVNPDGTYEINYDDGDEESDVIPEYIRFYDGPLPEGSDSGEEEEVSDDEYEDSQVRTIER